MNKLSVRIVLTFILTTVAFSLQAITFDEVKALGFPVVIIETINGEEPTCDYVEHPEGSMGRGITNATKVPGKVEVITPEGELIYSSGEYESKSTGMTVKIRGNTSAYRDKKPYKIKLEKKGDMLGRGDSRYNDKNWLLINDDESLQTCGFMVNELLGFPWAPAHQFVNVWFNGDYRGMYLLVEAVERNTDCRIDVAKSGYIVELDPYWWLEPDECVQSIWNPSYNYTFKYPDYEDMDADRIAFVSNSVLELENAMLNGDVGQVLNLESAAMWMLGHDIVGTYDSGGANKYFALDNNEIGTLWRMCTLWDFDGTHHNPEAWSNMHTDRVMGHLFDIDANPDFIRAYCQLWHEKGTMIFDELLNYTDCIVTSDEWAAFERSSKANFKRWPGSKQYTRARVAQLWREWFEHRRTFLDNNIAMLETTLGTENIIDTSGISVKNSPGCSTIVAENANTRIEIIDSSGRIIISSAGSVTITTKGFYIAKTPTSTIKLIVP